MKSRRAALSCALLATLAAPGCEEKKADAEAAVSTGTASLPLASAAKAADEQAAAPSAPAAKGPDDGKCPAGRWKYDYSDHALEVMVQNLAGAKVVKKEGEFICTVDEGKAGSIECGTTGKPVVNVVETKQAGMPMTVSVTITGKAVTKFELEDGRMKVVSSDMSALDLDAKVTLAGKDVPFPAEKLMTMFGDAESHVAYKCEGGNLMLKPEVDGVTATWQTLTPAPG